MNALNEKISEIGVVPVIKLNHPERDAANLGKALCAGGVPVAEITFRAAGADTAIRLMKEACPDMIVGAGTVTNTAQIDAVIAAGGQFIVSPGFDPELVQYAQEKNIPIFPGCTTASEYHQALKYGLEIIKFFPAEQSGGLAKIKALSAPFPHVPRHAHRRHQPEEPEGVPVQPGHCGLRRQLHGHGRPHRQPKVGRNHRALQKVQRNRQGSEGLTWN